MGAAASEVKQAACGNRLPETLKPLFTRILKMSIRQDLQDYISDNGLSQSAVARAVGVTSPVVNQYLHGKYPGNVQEIERKIAAYLQKQREREAERKLEVDYVLTTTAKRVRDVLRLAHVEGEAVVLFGQAGLGKTSSLREYCKQAPDALMIETDPTYTAKVLLQKLAAMLGAEGKGSLNELMDAVVGRLKDSGRIILVDEAENLPLRALECLRRVHDKTGCGLVLAGMPRLLVNLRGKNGELKQLYSRMAFKLDLGESVPDEDLAQIVAQAMPDMDEEAAAELVLTAAGNARRLDKMLRGVVRLARINRQEPSVEMVRQFAEMLIH